ncbi:hypothetical protein ACFL3C_04245 [Patescibacteria group bacterium]
MYWKEIPQETAAKDKTRKTHVSPRFQKHPVYKKNAKPIKLSYRLFQSVSRRLLGFIQKEGKYSLSELSYLITDLQRTIANLQAKRIQLWEKEKAKLAKVKKKQSKKKSKFKVKKII